MEEKESKGVAIPQETIAQSNEKKTRHRTLRQMPIYRDTANLKYLIVCLYEIVPRKKTRYIDTMLLTLNEAKKCIGLAHATHNKELRMEYLDFTRVFIEDIQDDLRILLRLNNISKDYEKQARKLAKAIVAQSIALRDYYSDQGGINL